MPELRELLVGSYRLIYRLRKERLEVVMLVHGRRRLAPIERLP